MRKILIGLIALLFVFMPFSVSAKTIKDYRNELASLKKEKEEAEKNKEETQKKIDEVNKEIERISNEMDKKTKEKETTEKEIKELEEKIVEKDKQIKELMSFYQISNSENFYLKYIFGAESFTDFIYRFSVIEQLTARNDELVDEMNDLVKENEEKVKKLEQEKKDLKELDKQVREKLSKYASQATKYNETSMDIDTQIRKVEEKIEYYKNQGCSENENLNTCMTTIPYDYGFNRPLKSGYINDEFGMRVHPISGIRKNHNGIDIGGNKEGTPVYAAAAGKVVDVMKKYYCGGNIVTINHVIDGKNYTTRYWHLLKIYVNEGDIVDKGDKIGAVGGGSTSYRNGGYDSCTTGTHLHFEMATGHYYGTGSDSYSSWSTYTKKVFDPRDMVYFPAYGVRW